MNIKKFFFFITFLFLSLLFSTAAPVLAGGGKIGLDPRANLEGWNDPSGTRMYIVRAFIDPRISCVNVPITFKFEDPRQGDQITVGSERQPFIIQGPSPRLHEGNTLYDCTTYAKVISLDRSQRYLYAQISMPDGTIYTSSKVSVDFGTNNPPDRTDDPITSPWDHDMLDDFFLGVASQEQIDCPKREIDLTWDQVEGVSVYTVFARLVGSDNFVSLFKSSSPGTKIVLNSCQDYYVKVEGCSAFNTCQSSGQVFISKVPPQSKNIFERIRDWLKSLF